MRKMLAVVAVVMISACALHKEPPVSEQDGNPLVLIAAGVVARTVQQDPHASAEDKKKAHDGLYEQAYRYARAEGLKRGARERYAAAFADDTALPDITCADFDTPPPDCQGAKAK